MIIEKIIHYSDLIINLESEKPIGDKQCIIYNPVSEMTNICIIN